MIFPSNRRKKKKITKQQNKFSINIQKQGYINQFQKKKEKEEEKTTTL